MTHDTRDTDRRTALALLGAAGAATVGLFLHGRSLLRLARDNQEQVIALIEAHGRARSSPPPPTTQARAQRGREMLPVHRSIVAVDIEGFGRLDRDNLIRGQLRQTMYAVLQRAFAQVGIDPDQYATFDIGDSVLVLINPSVSKVRLLDPLIGQLATGLAAHNRRLTGGPDRLRLRAVVHAGELMCDAHGVYGEDLNVAFRLLNAQPTKRHLAISSAPLVLAASDAIYQTVIKHGYGGIDPSSYQPVRISEKETRTRGWIYVPPIPALDNVAMSR